MSKHRTWARAGALAVAAGTAYGVSIWPRMNNWGATPREIVDRMPGDEVVGEARYRTTHAVTIDAPAEAVWPWLVQIGQGRGGMYSYDWLENLVGLDMHSAESIRPELQHLAVGDSVRLVPEDNRTPINFTVLQVEPPYLLVLGPGASREDALAAGLPYPCWTFKLSPRGHGRSRLVVRFRSDFKPTVSGWFTNRVALEPVHFLMERKMLLTIKERAERIAA